MKGRSAVVIAISTAFLLDGAAIAVPRLRAARRFSQETAALQDLRTIRTAQDQFQYEYGRDATSLAELAGAGLIDQALGSGLKDGHRFRLTLDGSGYRLDVAPQDGPQPPPVLGPISSTHGYPAAETAP